MTADRFTAAEMTRALYRHFTQRWAILCEVSARPDHNQDPGAENKVRRIDLLMLRAGDVPGGIERLAIEIKVTRADFLSDIRNPAKQAPWRDLAHRHAYAVPLGLVAAHEVPIGSGLLTVERSTVATHGQAGVLWSRRAKRVEGHDPGPLPRSNVMDGFWRAARAEAQLKGHGFGVGCDDDVEGMRTELVRLRRELERTSKQLDRESDARQRWQRAFGAVGAPPCATCGRPLHPKRSGYSFTWEHRVRAQQDECNKARRVAAELADLDLPEARRSGSRYVYVPDPEPVELPNLEETA